MPSCSRRRDEAHSEERPTVANTEAVPDFFTVEEAAQILRIGRTAAYALARQWRVTDGHEGLPVVAFGRLLRVPRAALESFAGGPLRISDTTGVSEQAATKEVHVSRPHPREATPSRPRRTTRHNDQSTLFSQD
jgi:excisionase family DNA binding protein